MSYPRELREGAPAAGIAVLLGVVLGLAWLWLAPRVPLVSDGSAVYLDRPEGEEAIGSDGTFVLLGLAVGALVGLVVFLLHRKGGVGLVVGLTVGCLLGALAAWRIGVWLGPTSDLAAHARAAGKGAVFDGPLELKAKGALLAYPFGALVTHLLCTSLGTRDAPEPPPDETSSHGSAPHEPPAPGGSRPAQ
ncbi:ABC transporter permease [Streptomyces sp. TR06-5]|uniref:ABC transporter permease n=1 Tax=unclassified Streptomyces TaxID=2593676 RepID=UPI0039A08C9D